MPVAQASDILLPSSTAADLDVVVIETVTIVEIVTEIIYVTVPVNQTIHNPISTDSHQHHPGAHNHNHGHGHGHFEQPALPLAPSPNPPFNSGPGSSDPIPAPALAPGEAPNPAPDSNPGQVEGPASGPAADPAAASNAKSAPNSNLGSNTDTATNPNKPQSWWDVSANNPAAPAAYLPAPNGRGPYVQQTGASNYPSAPFHYSTMAAAAVLNSIFGLSALNPSLPQSATNGTPSFSTYNLHVTNILRPGASELGLLKTPKLPDFLTNNVTIFN